MLANTPAEWGKIYITLPVVESMLIDGQKMWASLMIMVLRRRDIPVLQLSISAASVLYQLA